MLIHKHQISYNGDRLLGEDHLSKLLNDCQTNYFDHTFPV